MCGSCKISWKNPAQHYADFEMLQIIDELQPAFVNVNSHTNKELSAYVSMVLVMKDFPMLKCNSGGVKGI